MSKIERRTAVTGANYYLELLGRRAWVKIEELGNAKFCTITEQGVAVCDSYKEFMNEVRK